MDSKILGLKVASFLFGLISLAQLLRLVMRAEVFVAGISTAALAERAGLRDPGRPEPLAVEARALGGALDRLIARARSASLRNCGRDDVPA